MKTLSLTLLALLAAGCTGDPAGPKDTASTDDLDGDGFTVADGDCDDAEELVNPEEPELWYDGIDQDCDGNDDDQDLDGEPVADDCDDTDPSVYPGAEEVCDGADNDCDGDADVGAVDATTGWVDADLDGHGAIDEETTYCGEPPEGVATVGDDCDDTAATAYPGAEEVCDDLDNDCDGEINEGNPEEVPYYRDADADGYGDPADSVISCAPPTGYVADGTDCNDAISVVNPGAVEYCDDTDRDCDGDPVNDPADGTAYYADADLDGYGDAAAVVTSCTEVDGYLTDASDCDDTNAAINPAAAEVCDGVDDDCTGVADDGLAYTDVYADTDGDSYGDAAASVSACDLPDGYSYDPTDCDDADGLVYPGAEELCDLEDNDCDGTADDDATDARTYYADADADGYGDAATMASACGLPSGYSETDDDCDDATYAVNPGATETCNGIDDDCDDTTDEPDAADATTYYADTDGDGFGDAGSTTLSCDGVDGYVTDATDCDDASSLSNPDATELCDGGDNDCDGDTDEDSAADATTWFVDGDGDGYGSSTATTNACELPTGYAATDEDCDDGDASVKPGGTESCNDVDDDCDGNTDESGAVGELTWYRDADGDGSGVSTDTTLACDAPGGYAPGTGDCDDTEPLMSPSGAEADDLLDNDCDGWVDEDFVSAGDIIVSEIHRQPRFGATSVNADGQWFELYNTSSRDVDLSNWYVQRVTSSVAAKGFYVDPDDGIVLAAGAYAVFCKTDDYTAASTSASTLACDYIWGDPTGSSTYSGTYHSNAFTLQTNDDALKLYVGGSATSGTLVDEVHWTYSATDGYWPRDATRSTSLDPASLDATDNDSLSAWCSNANTSGYRWYHSGSANEYGTPGAANYDCP